MFGTKVYEIRRFTEKDSIAQIKPKKARKLIYAFALKNRNVVFSNIEFEIFPSAIQIITLKVESKGMFIIEIMFKVCIAGQLLRIKKIVHVENGIVKYRYVKYGKDEYGQLVKDVYSDLLLSFERCVINLKDAFQR